MFKKIETLNKETHQNLKLGQTNSFEFAKLALNAPVSVSELALSACHYPIVFPLDSAVPTALFALKQKENFYVDADGKWKAPYVPAHIRRYPFILSPKPSAASHEDSQNASYVVCVDTTAPHFKGSQGESLFDSEGKPADITRNAISFLERFQKELNAAQLLCQDLESNNLLVEKTVSIKKDGQKSSVGGFRCVDMKKLYAFEDSVLAGWVRNGLMALINIHQASLVNLKKLA